MFRTTNVLSSNSNNNSSSESSNFEWDSTTDFSSQYGNLYTVSHEGKTVKKTSGSQTVTM